MSSRTSTLALLSLLLFLSVHALRFHVPSSNGKLLQRALDSAKPGDTIILGKGTFKGPFYATTSGNQTHPITLTTSLLTLHQTEISGNKLSGVGLTILGNYWNIFLLRIANFDTAVLLKGNVSTLDTINVRNVNTAVKIHGRGNSLKFCMLKANHVGIDIREGGDVARVIFNDVEAVDKAIVADKKTCCGHLAFNTVTGNVSIFGRFYSYDENLGKEKESGGQRPGIVYNLFCSLVIAYLLILA